jgi:hypothetical protein
MDGQTRIVDESSFSRAKVAALARRAAEGAADYKALTVSDKDCKYYGKLGAYGLELAYRALRNFDVEIANIIDFPYGITRRLEVTLIQRKGWPSIDSAMAELDPRKTAQDAGILRGSENQLQERLSEDSMPD